MRSEAPEYRLKYFGASLLFHYESNFSTNIMMLRIFY